MHIVYVLKLPQFTQKSIRLPDDSTHPLMQWKIGLEWSTFWGFKMASSYSFFNNKSAFATLSLPTLMMVSNSFRALLVIDSFTS